jgi:hypothetical protein
LDQAQVDLIQGKILAAVVNLLGETPLQFLYSKFEQCIFWINCANESPNVYLMQTISRLGELTVLVHIPDTAEVTTLKSHLRIQNPELNTADWLTISQKVTEK